MICESREVPSVVTTSACVSPRVNSADPWVRGRTPTFTVIGRTVIRSRPSIRGSPFRIFCRTRLLSSLNEGVLDLLRGELRRIAAAERELRLRLHFGQLIAALELFGDGVSLGHGGLRVHGHGAREFRVGGGSFPLPARAACGGHEFLDDLDGRLHLLMTEHHGAQHHFFREARGLGFDHQHGLLGAGDHQVELRLGELLGGWVEQVLTVLPADARRADGAVERNSRQRQRRGGAEQRGDVRVDLRIDATARSRRPARRCRSCPGRADGAAGR